MNVLMDDIRWFKEFPIKTCRECRFSTGGQLFAAVNGNIIHIFSSYTCEPFMALRGHNGKVRSVSWLNDDTNLVSSGAAGADL
jgi:WD40 repeat protein